MVRTGNRRIGDVDKCAPQKGIACLTRSTIKDYLQVRIPQDGRRTVAFFATVENDTAAACPSPADLLAWGARSSLVAKNATTWPGKIFAWPCAKHPVVKDYLTTGHAGNRQGLLGSSIAILEQRTNWTGECGDAP